MLNIDISLLRWSLLKITEVSRKFNLESFVQNFTNKKQLQIINAK